MLFFQHPDGLFQGALRAAALAYQRMDGGGKVAVKRMSSRCRIQYTPYARRVTSGTYTLQLPCFADLTQPFPPTGKENSVP